MSKYLSDSFSNGNPLEQALIRRWWYEEKGAKGQMVWEYYLEGRYIDGMLFYSVESCESEVSGLNATELFPLCGQDAILCEAKRVLNPEVIGQALVYSQLALRAGANLLEKVVLVERGTEPMREVAIELGLTVVVRPLE